MKKLLLLAITCVLGIMTNASTVKWQVTNIQSSPSTTVAANWVVQIYTSGVTFDYAKAVSGEISATFSGSTVAASSGSSFRASGEVKDGQEKNTTVSYYMVIYDDANIANAKNYIVSSAKSVTANASGSDVPLSFGSMSSTNTSNMFNNSSWVAVPEPTSGLLMFLGAAGLALKRKKA